MLRSRWHEENGRCHVRSWPIASVRCLAAIRPELKVKGEADMPTALLNRRD